MGTIKVTEAKPETKKKPTGKKKETEQKPAVEVTAVTTVEEKPKTTVAQRGLLDIVEVPNPKALEVVGDEDENEDAADAVDSDESSDEEGEETGKGGFLDDDPFGELPSRANGTAEKTVSFDVDDEDEGPSDQADGDEGEDGDVGVLHVYSENCFRCTLLAPGMEGEKGFRAFKKCSAEAGNENCPAASVRVVIGIPVRQLALSLLKAEEENDFAKIARIFARVSAKDDSVKQVFKNTVAQMRRQLESESDDESPTG